MKIAVRILWYFAFFWVFILCAGTFVQYLTFKQDTQFLQIKEQAVATGWYLPAFYCHVLGSSVLLIAGYFQFSARVYRNMPLHRSLGKLYVFGVLFFASPGAYVMTLFVNRGTGVFISFLLQNTLWVAFTIAGWLYILKGNVNTHVKMMRYSYALAFGAVMLRFYIWLFTVAGIGVNFSNNYLIIAFLSWVPNLIIAGLINRSRAGSSIKLSANKTA